jgi:alkylation response protein AidB-like acyl-CoA dehydrogenase
MDFNLTEDRRMLADTLNRYLTDNYSAEHRESVAYTAPYHDPARWSELAELGVLLALAPEDAGGFGGSGFDISVVFEALGRANCPEPILPALLAARLLTKAEVDQETLLSGGTHYAVALGEIEAPYELNDIQTVAAVKGADYTLSGRKSAVYGGHIAEVFLVVAKLNDKLSLFEVAASDASVESYGLIDGGGAAELLLDNTPARMVMEDAAAAVQDVMNVGTLAVCAEAIGLMDVIHDTTLEYMKMRNQFGKPIGSFQALQHRAVDMLMEIEQARSIVIKAASELEGENAARYISMAKNLVGRAARLNAEEAIQLHGGIAMTWEYPVSHYVKRLIMIDHQFGDTDFHLARIMADLKVA